MLVPLVYAPLLPLRKFLFAVDALYNKCNKLRLATSADYATQQRSHNGMACSPDWPQWQGGTQDKGHHLHWGSADGVGACWVCDVWRLINGSWQLIH